MNSFEKVTEIILNKLNAGIIPWRKTWKTDESIPYNCVSGKDYKGLNLWLLEPGAYLTLKQANAFGGHVKKGSRGHLVTFWKCFEDEETEKKSFLLRNYHVFNLSDIEGIAMDKLKIKTPVQLNSFEKIERCEAIYGNMQNKPNLVHDEARAYYRPSTDTVNMPKQGLFDVITSYYATLFHELGHSTGADTRLKRDTLVAQCGFGSKTYAKEELVAELCAAGICAECQIDNVIDNSVAYIQTWMHALANDTSLIIYASARAQKAVNYIMGK